LEAKKKDVLPLQRIDVSKLRNLDQTKITLDTDLTGLPPEDITADEIAFQSQSYNSLTGKASITSIINRLHNEARGKAALYFKNEHKGTAYWEASSYKSDFAEKTKAYYNQKIETLLRDIKNTETRAMMAEQFAYAKISEENKKMSQQKIKDALSWSDTITTFTKLETVVSNLNIAGVMMALANTASDVISGNTITTPRNYKYGDIDKLTEHNTDIILQTTRDARRENANAKAKSEKFRSSLQTWDATKRFEALPVEQQLYWKEIVNGKRPVPSTGSTGSTENTENTEEQKYSSAHLSGAFDMDTYNLNPDDQSEQKRADAFNAAFTQYCTTTKNRLPGCT
jgi:hypothetical protein